MNRTYEVIVLGAGAAGIMAAISAAQEGKKVLLLEKLPKIAAKLKATGGGKCNLTNTLSSEDFMKKFGKYGRFMSEALNSFNALALREFFDKIGVKTHAPDGFRVFPKGHNAQTVLNALRKELNRLKVEVVCSVIVEEISKKKESFFLHTKESTFKASQLIIATGGLGYPSLGATGDGYIFAKTFGHSVSSLYPAMMPLITKEKWVSFCKADTIANAILKIDLPKYKKLKAKDDLIFTQNGIRGPVVLDFAREITPILKKQEEVPLLVNLTKGLNEEQIYTHLKTTYQKNPMLNMLELVSSLVPKSVAKQLCLLCEVEESEYFKTIQGAKKERVVKNLAWTPLTVVAHDGFKNAMITKGGVSLKEIDPKTMQSKLVSGLYFCGEVVDLDGPCGGYNLQWSFSSGFLAGKTGRDSA